MIPASVTMSEVFVLTFEFIDLCFKVQIIMTYIYQLVFFQKFLFEDFMKFQYFIRIHKSSEFV